MAHRTGAFAIALFAPMTQRWRSNGDVLDLFTSVRESNEEWGNARRNELLPDLVRIGADVSLVVRGATYKGRLRDVAKRAG